VFPNAFFNHFAISFSIQVSRHVYFFWHLLWQSIICPCIFWYPISDISCNFSFCSISSASCNFFFWRLFVFPNAFFNHFAISFSIQVSRHVYFFWHLLSQSIICPFIFWYPISDISCNFSPFSICSISCSSLIERIVSRPMHMFMHIDTYLHWTWQLKCFISFASFKSLKCFIAITMWSWIFNSLICSLLPSIGWIFFSTDSSTSLFCLRFLKKEITAEPTQPSTHNFTNLHFNWQFRWASVFAFLICAIAFLVSSCSICFTAFTMAFFNFCWFSILSLSFLVRDFSSSLIL